MGTTLEATIVGGLGAASATLSLQMPHLIRQFSKIANCHHATINVQLDLPLRVNNPDYTTQPIAWHSSRPQYFEKFSFLQIGFECPIGEVMRDAWVYVAHNSPHYTNLFIAEILTTRMDEAHVKVGMRCRVHISKDIRTSEVLII
jgi:hypothetical protein